MHAHNFLASSQFKVETLTSRGMLLVVRRAEASAHISSPGPSPWPCMTQLRFFGAALKRAAQLPQNTKLFFGIL